MRTTILVIVEAGQTQHTCDIDYGRIGASIGRESSLDALGFILAAILNLPNHLPFIRQTAYQ
jgi:hypothetical protein